MDAGRIVVHLDVPPKFFASLGIRIDLQIAHLGFQRAPKTFDRLIITGCPRPRHALAKSCPLYHFLCLLRRILTAAITMIDRALWSLRIPTYCHLKRCLYQTLPLVPLNRPPDDPTGSHIDDTAQIQLSMLVFYLRDIRAPKVICLCYGELVLEQILLHILLFRHLPLLGSTRPTSFGYQLIFFQYSADSILTYRNSCLGKFFF